MCRYPGDLAKKNRLPASADGEGTHLPSTHASICKLKKGKLKYNRSHARLYYPTIAQGSSMRHIIARALQFMEPQGRGSLRADHLS